MPFYFFNCTAQYSRFIVQYSVIVGRNLVWLETNLTPTMTIFFLDSINQVTMTDQYKNEVSSTVSEWCNVSDAEYKLQVLIINIKCQDCVSDKVQLQAPLTEQLLYSQLVLPPYTLQCLPFYIINEVGHLTTSVDHLAEFCQNYHLAAICTQLMVKFFLQLRFI